MSPKAVAWSGLSSFATAAHSFIFGGPTIVERIDIHGAEDIAHWCRTFGCSESELKEAVIIVGDVPERVGLFLQQKGQKRSAK